MKRAAVFVGFWFAILGKGWAGEVSYSRDVRAILSDKCFKCHGFDEKTREGDLRLDVKEGEEGSAGVLVAGDSLLLERIFSDDPDEVMPPPSAKKPLSEAERAVLKQWVEEGAEYEAHWAFGRIERPEVVGGDGGWAKNGVDGFVWRGLEGRGMRPSAEADRWALVRRVYLDLIGVPPSVEEAEAFVNDPRPDAYESLVDDLLGREAYGERWARRWLDLARYADTNGYEKDRPRSIWPYRDWVIGALNSGMGFDEFTVKQLAGDLLPGATQDDLVATGFHRNTMLNEEGGIDPLEFRFYSMTDRVGTTGTAWMGLTVSCAQCHTHKYDPISHTEYYGLMAYLNNADEPEIPVWTDELRAAHARAEAEAVELEDRLADFWPREERVLWETVGEPEVRSEGGAAVEVKEGGVVEFGGAAPETDVSVFRFETRGGVERLRLEALPVGQSGPGRTAHGNFVVTEIEVKAGPAGGELKPVKLVGATADFSQQGYDAAGAVDGKPQTGWGVDGPGRRHEKRELVVQLGEKVERQGGTRWEVRVVQGLGGTHTLGRVRLSAGVAGEGTGEPRALAETAFEKWVEAKRAEAVKWKVIKPVGVESEVPRLEILEDGSVLASGDQTKSDTYTISYAGDFSGVTAVRLEALPDERLPAGGPGRTFYEGRKGDFFLSEFDVVTGGEDAAIATGKENFGKLAIGGGASTAQLALDGDAQTGWSASGREGKPSGAVFVFAEPLKGDGKGMEVKLLFEKHYSVGLGRLRVSVTRDPKAGRGEVLPAEVEAALVEGGGREVLWDYWVSVVPELAEARKRVAAVRAKAPKVPTTLVMRERAADHLRVTRRHHRGEWLQAEEAVGAGLPKVFEPLLGDGEAPKDRLEFARWLVSRDNPLTARVVANRAWQAFFGRGLVKTVDDFGFQGELPSHPELLDWLAMELMDSGWKMKALHRTIVTSATYQQSSAVTAGALEHDPENVFLARAPRVRLEAEQVRDAALAASGLLTRKVGGPSVFPPQPASVTTEGAYGRLAWKVSTGADRWRRSLYTYAKRTTPFAMGITFDGPTGEACVARREVSNTPLQALTLMNDTVFLECAQKLGETLAAMDGEDAGKVRWLWKRCLTREADAGEVDDVLGYLRAQRERLGDGSLKAKEISGGGDPERAVWALVARVVLNLDEMIVKQ